MWRQKRAQRAERTSHASALVSSFTCRNCGKEYHSRIGHYSNKHDSAQNKRDAKTFRLLRQRGQ
uniref:Uncharacterized protein n=2 Tax=Arion vulgaris TaxID=1028688 RepID=A0A0B7B0G1_9EUPU